jgi:putative endonuclease
MSKKIGDLAESKATGALKDHGYEILERNFRSRLGEIDVIAEKDGFICFVEVKYRRKSGFGTAVDAITKSKMRKILLTAKRYLYEIEKSDADYRIDAVVIDGDNVEILPNVYTQGMHDI